MLDKDTYFEMARSLTCIFQSPDAVPDALQLKTVKLVGPELTEEEVLLSRRDTNFLSRLVVIAGRIQLPLQKNFKGTFDTLREYKKVNRTDFLTSPEQSDILSINYVVKTPDTEVVTDTLLQAQAINEISPVHHLKNAWDNAAKNHQAKVIFIFCNGMEISPNDFDSEHYELLYKDESREVPCYVLIDKDYHNKIRGYLDITEASPTSTPIHRQAGTTLQM